MPSLQGSGFQVTKAITVLCIHYISPSHFLHVSLQCNIANEWNSAQLSLATCQPYTAKRNVTLLIEQKCSYKHQLALIM